MLFDAYNESDVFIVAVNGTLKERGIIRNAFRQIKSTRTETTLLIAGNTGFTYSDWLLTDQRKMMESTKRRNTRITRSDGALLWQSKNKGLG